MIYNFKIRMSDVIRRKMTSNDGKKIVIIVTIINIYHIICIMEAQADTLNNQSGSNLVSVSNVIYASVAIFIVYSYYKLKKARTRHRMTNKPTHMIEKGNIIIALQIRDFLVKLSEKNLYGYLPLNIQTTSKSIFQIIRRKILNLGDYYKPMFPVSKIKEFIVGLSSIPKVSLILYTSLQPQVAEVLLYKLGIDKNFPVNQRKYCDLMNHDDQKHAIQVDQDSRRVIIITPIHTDHRSQDDKYFLVLRPKQEQGNYLKNQLKSLKNFVQKNEDINNLHEELAEFKVVIDSESDYQM